MSKKEFFINAVQMINIEGSTNIPTVLYYPSTGKEVIGYVAQTAAGSTFDVLNENFKIELGNSDPTSAAPKKRYTTSKLVRKTAADLTSDFLHQLILHTKDWLNQQGYEKNPNILLAEPLAMQTGLVESSWLSNYRRNLQRILFGKSFDKIDFLPEPFAVFQYYRYGIRHPLVAQRIRHNALVLDFGGGTFDVCVISTTKEGDISQTGRNSKPLAASSIPTGGFTINQLIALDIFRKQYSQKHKSRFKKASRTFHQWQKSKGEFDTNTLAAEFSCFIRNLRRTIHSVEDLKLTICRNIPNWSLNDPVILTAPITIPEDPYVDDNRTISVRYSALELRSLFEDKIWTDFLKPNINRAFERAHEELEGAPISVVLLSGGSANIGWLRKLLQRDFEDELSRAEILNLPDFQEVVAKGLAVECARRFFTPHGDFASVTYNRLCLILNSDNTGNKLIRFQPKIDGLPQVRDMPGVLLPSASLLSKFIDKKMLWKFHLDSPPRKILKYYFLRSSFEPSYTENLQNIEEISLFTPRKCVFDRDIKLQLTIEEDGTARPSFIYKSGRSDEETTILEGRPFYLDMTFGNKSSENAQAYIGLDFGSSNTSLSFVTEDSVEIFYQRSGNEAWKDLSDLVSTLPYPLSEPLSRYLSQTDPTKLTKTAFEFVEASLAFLAYVSLCDYRINTTEESKLFRNLTQRSVGPLWALLREISKKNDSHKLFSDLRKLMVNETYRRIDESVSYFSLYKHDKAAEGSIDVLRVVQILANAVQLSMDGWIFGFFEQVQRQPFSNQLSGRFRHACGNPPFSDIWEYKGQETFSEDQAFLVNPNKMICIPLQPFIFWDVCPIHSDLDFGHCYLFDRAERGDDGCSFKAVGCTCVIDTGKDSRYQTINDHIMQWRQKDLELNIVSIGELNAYSSEDGHSIR